MAQQVESVELLRSHRELLRHGGEMRCQKIVRILNQLFLGELIHEVPDRARTHESNGETAHALDQRMRALQQHAHLKSLMDAMLVHARLATAVPFNRPLRGHREASIRTMKAAPVLYHLCHYH